MAKDLLDSNDDGLFPPSSDERENSALQDILAVTAKIKEAPQNPGGEDSGMIVFSTGDFGGGDQADDDALFGFAGGLGGGSLGAGFGGDPLTSPDLTPLGGEGRVSEQRPAEIQAKPVDEPKRSALVALAVVLGLALLGASWIYVTHEDQSPQADQPARAEMSANTAGAAVGHVDEPSPKPVVEDPDADPNAGLAPAEAGEAEAGEAEAGEAGVDSEGAEGAGEADPGTGVLGDANDPMAQKQGLLEGSGGTKVAKAGTWDQGESASKPAVSPDPKPAADPEPAPVAEPDPLPAKKPAGGGSEDEIECLLNPDLAKCKTGGASKPKTDEVLAPKLPDKLSSNQLRDGFNSIKSKAKACGAKFGAEAGTKVKVHASIEGATGAVSSVEATGEHAGTSLGKCVEDVVKGATFEQFKKQAMGVDYSLSM